MVSNVCIKAMGSAGMNERIGLFAFRIFCFLSLVYYIWYILNFTIFTRSDYPEYKYKLIPFWSYGAIMDGQTFLIEENVLNVALFAPVGLLLYVIISYKKWWLAFLFGVLLSVVIEILQLCLKKGFFEFDDVFHNSLGCLLGYLIALVVTKKCVSRKSAVDSKHK